MSTLELPDGRRAQFWLGGAADGSVIAFFHGCPDTRWVARTGEGAARDCGVRLLCVNRPGYGHSDPTTSSLTSVAADLVAVADRLEVRPVAALGMSFGGVYAAAFAAFRPDLVQSLGIVAAPAMAEAVETSVEEAMESYRPEYQQYVAHIHPEDEDDTALVQRWLAHLPPEDAAALRAVPVRQLAASAREALAQDDGYLRDAALVLREWDLRVEDIRAPTHLWYGAEDRRNPPSVAAWWAERVAVAHVVVRPATTHLSTLVSHWPDILATLRSGLTAP